MRSVVLIIGLAITSSTGVWGGGGGGLIAQESVNEFDMRATTWTEFGGSLDFIMGLMGVNNAKTQRTMVSGPAGTIRMDEIEDGQVKSTNIMQYSTGDMHVIDHEDKSYYTFNFSNMMGGGPFQVGGETPPADYEQPEPDEDGAEYELSMSIESPGGAKTLLNYQTEQVWMTLTATPTKAPEGVSLDSMPIFVMLTELWVAEDFPGSKAMAEISQEAAAQLSKSIGVDGDAMAQAFSQNPRFAQAFEQNQEEMEKLRHMPLEQLSVFVSHMPWVEFNADSALHGSMGEVKIDVAGAIASGVTNAVTGGITRRLGIGRRREPDPPPAPPPAVQTLMFRVHELVEEFTVGGLMAGWDAIPDGYEQKENPFQVRQPN